MSKPERTAGRRSNVRPMSVNTRQNASKHVKTTVKTKSNAQLGPPSNPTDPSNPTFPPDTPSNPVELVKCDRPVRPSVNFGRESRPPALRSHDHVSPLPSPPLARPIGRLAVGFTLPARVARPSALASVKILGGGAALRQNDRQRAPAQRQRALRAPSCVKPVKARRPARPSVKPVKCPSKHGPRAGPYYPPASCPA